MRRFGWYMTTSGTLLLQRVLVHGSHLLYRGYETSFVQDQIVRASHIRRKDALTPWTRTRCNKRVPLVITYYSNLNNFTALTKNNLPVLRTSNYLENAIPERPPITYRRPTNLRDLLIKAALMPTRLQPASGSSPCGTRCCLTCSHV